MRRGLVNLISRSQRSVTILFTDIVDSTVYWGRQGDIQGRLMVDQHNRLVFPVIKKYRGKVIKTIGDAVMASFEQHEDAVRAAIGIQQALEAQRRKDEQFTLQLRIGLHTGPALVEKQDVFGDTVNVASRVEGYAEAGELLISAAIANELDKKTFRLFRKGNFVPKGKRKSITVYHVDWQNHPSLIEDINFNSVLPVLARQRLELFIYLSVSLGLVYFLFQKYLRYFIVDQQRIELLTYSPQQLLSEHPYTIAAMAVAALGLLLFLRYLFIAPLLWLRLLKGTFIYAILFFVLYYAAPYLPQGYRYNADRVLYESGHQFVEILSDEARLYAEPDPATEVLRSPHIFEIFLLSETRAIDPVQWYRVSLGEGVDAWVEEVRPQAMGVAERRLSQRQGFSFRYLDLYILLFPLLGLMWGIFSFKVRPV